MLFITIYKYYNIVNPVVDQKSFIRLSLRMISGGQIAVKKIVGKVVDKNIKIIYIALC